MTIGRLFVISAPSGAGKTTLLSHVMARIPGLVFSVSHTTRLPRPGERDGIDYHFVGRDEFHSMIEQGRFLEYAEVHGNLYGTSQAAIRQQLEEGIDVVLDIDVQGAAILRNSGQMDAASIFISPPSMAELEKRLRGRGTESEERVRLRMKNARQELQAVEQYEYLIINEDLADAADLLAAVILAERARAHRLPSGKPIEKSVTE
ncbi:MAG: guanylate kinase [Desulfobulbaceae bacterium BRH_c16a]|nr:MAG: guanylate kinase [Desulfobulbaceae bacterium BRH_c16a]